MVDIYAWVIRTHLEHLKQRKKPIRSSYKCIVCPQHIKIQYHYATVYSNMCYLALKKITTCITLFFHKLLIFGRTNESYFPDVLHSQSCTDRFNRGIGFEKQTFWYRLFEKCEKLPRYITNFLRTYESFSKIFKIKFSEQSF